MSSDKEMPSRLFLKSWKLGEANPETIVAKTKEPAGEYVQANATGPRNYFKCFRNGIRKFPKWEQKMGLPQLFSCSHMPPLAMIYRCLSAACPYPDEQAASASDSETSCACVDGVHDGSKAVSWSSFRLVVRYVGVSIFTYDRAVLVRARVLQQRWVARDSGVFLIFPGISLGEFGLDHVMRFVAAKSYVNVWFSDLFWSDSNL